MVKIMIMKIFSIQVLFLLIIFSLTCLPVAAISGDNQSRGEPLVLVRTDATEYIAGERINISITVRNENNWNVEPVLQYEIVYDNLNLPVVKGVVARDIQPNYNYSLFKTLPDYAPPGKYQMVISMVSNNGKVLGSASSDLVIEANYAGMGGAVALFVLYGSSVLILFYFIIYCLHFEQGDI